LPVAFEPKELLCSVDPRRTVCAGDHPGISTGRNQRRGSSASSQGVPSDAVVGPKCRHDRIPSWAFRRVCSTDTVRSGSFP
jgi:hypothetical protein